MANINSMNVGGQLSMIEDTAAREMEASAYDPTQTYVKEDIVIYDNKLYEANQAISTAEAFNIAHWTETTLGKIAQKHRDSISQLTENIDITKEITIIATSDNVVLDSYKAYKCGNIVNLCVSFHSASKIIFSSDTNTFRFSIDKYKPVIGMNSALYTGTNAGICAIDVDGTISIRMAETQGYIDQSFSMDARFSYIAA